MDRMQVVLNQAYKGNVRGEVAWFPVDEAEKMVAAKLADRYEAAVAEPAPSSNEEAVKNEVKQVSEIDEDAAVAALLKEPKRTKYRNRQITSESAEG